MNLDELNGKEFVYLSKTGGKTFGIIDYAFVDAHLYTIDGKYVSHIDLINKKYDEEDLFIKYISKIKSTNGFDYDFNEIMIKKFPEFNIFPFLNVTDKLKYVAEKIKDKECFPESNERARKTLQNIVFDGMFPLTYNDIVIDGKYRHKEYGLVKIHDIRKDCPDPDDDCLIARIIQSGVVLKVDPKDLNKIKDEEDNH